MPTLHFLNVKEGDCSVIQHFSGNVTVIDVNNAKKPSPWAPVRGLGNLGDILGSTGLRGSFGTLSNQGLLRRNALAELLSEQPRPRNALAELGLLRGAARINFNQKDHPVNPIEYFRERDIKEVFRFILTHPDMDHMGGIKDFFEEFKPSNFWDTDNNKEQATLQEKDRADWAFYKNLRDSKPQENPKRLTVYSKSKNKFYNQFETGQGGGDGLHILAPTKEFVQEANHRGSDYNLVSYVILYYSIGGKILFGGDSHDRTWEYILEDPELRAIVEDVDILIAPHHGRDSDRSYDFLRVLKPKLTLFGIAKSDHLGYTAWNRLSLPVITNNEANCIIVDIQEGAMHVYVTNPDFARQENNNAFWNNELKAYYLGQVGQI